MKSKGYTVVLATPVVQIDSIVARCAARAQAANCDKKHLSAKKKAAADNFEQIADKCDMVAVFDNNVARGQPFNPVYVKRSDGTSKTFKPFSVDFGRDSLIDPIKKYIESRASQ